jgi:SET domain-containing protein
MDQMAQTAHRRHRCPIEKPALMRGLLVTQSALAGLCCFATVHFPKDGPIAEYAGERITHAEAMWRMRGESGKCISQLDPGHYVDGSVGGNETQYINHSCDPNANVLVMDGFMIVFALREIQPGEEVTVDYLNSFAHDLTLCQCRAASCRNNQRTA